MLDADQIEALRDEPSKPKRIQLSRAKGWRMPAGAVKVDRSTRWGNPWIVGEPGRFWLPDYPLSRAPVLAHISQDDAVGLFRHLLTGSPDPVRAVLPAALNPAGLRDARDRLRAHASWIIAHLAELRGIDLACWCAVDAPCCHADVLLEIANG